MEQTELNHNLEQAPSSDLAMVKIKEIKVSSNPPIKKTETLSEIIKEYLKTPVAEATVNIFLTSHLALKIFLTIFVLGLSGLASYTVIDSILSYFKYEVSTTSRTIYETSALFPKITFCNVNPYTTEYAYNLSISPIKSTPTIDQHKMFSHDLNDILIDCKFNDIKCNSTDFVWS